MLGVGALVVVAAIPAATVQIVHEYEPAVVLRPRRLPPRIAEGRRYRAPEATSAS